MAAAAIEMPKDNAKAVPIKLVSPAFCVCMWFFPRIYCCQVELQHPCQHRRYTIGLGSLGAIDERV